MEGFLITFCSANSLQIHQGFSRKEQVSLVRATFPLCVPSFISA